MGSRNKAKVKNNRPKGCIPEDYDVLVEHWYLEKVELLIYLDMLDVDHIFTFVLWNRYLKHTLFKHEILLNVDRVILE